jgi:hypothetical protein
MRYTPLIISWVEIRGIKEVIWFFFICIFGKQVSMPSFIRFFLKLAKHMSLFSYQQFTSPPASLPAYFIPEVHPFYITRLTLEKLAEHCWQVYYARHYESTALGSPEIISGTLRVGRSPEECERELLRVLNGFPQLVKSFQDKIKAGILTFRVKEKDWPYSELLHRDYHDVEMAALAQTGVSNEMIRWMFREGKCRLRTLEDKPLLGEKHRLRELEFTITDYILKKYLRSVG